MYDVNSVYYADNKSFKKNMIGLMDSGL